MRQELKFDTAFSQIAIPEWEPKPRGSGITMVIDWGIGLNEQTDVIGTSGYFIDIAKIAVGMSRLIPREYLAKKIGLYKQNDIQPFPGGQWLELAILQNRVSEYFEAASAIGYEYVEVSDNAIAISPNRKKQIIQQAIESGLEVIGEVGKKVSTTDVDALVSDVENTLEGGAWKVFVEAKEIFGEELNRDIIQKLANSLDISKLIFEIPGAYVQPVHNYEQYEMWRWLLNCFGPKVNIASILPGDSLKLAALRLGVGPDTDYEPGAFCRSVSGELSKHQS